ncbi:MAG: helix-turn-helix transcriptional regulator [Flavobacteriaceae bacterium]|jgi:transcriptional regulator with XRE-family HTH domain|nr:helix-turn-helix transcriptional regulator [Flavobacteriaceae bacterium]
MTELQRIKKVVNWLIFIEFADSDKDLAEKLGYTKSSFSQIINGKVPLAEKFIKKLCSTDENINEVWITEGKGSMLKEEYNLGSQITIHKEVLDVLKAQSESLKSKDKQIDELLSLLKIQISKTKKTDARRGENVSSAVAGLSI